MRFVEADLVVVVQDEVEVEVEIFRSLQFVILMQRQWIVNDLGPSQTLLELRCGIDPHYCYLPNVELAWTGYHQSE